MYDELTFSKFTMDMMSLEASMTLFEYENGLTPEFLNSDDDDSYYSESCESADGSFYDSLFEDDFVPATEGFKETMGKIGRGIKSAAVTVLGAIKKAFISLGNKISGFFSNWAEGIQRASAKRNPYVAKLLQNTDIQKTASRMEAAFKAISLQAESANVTILPIINKINKAFNNAAIGNSSKASISEDDLKSMSDSFTSEYGVKNTNKMGDTYATYKKHVSDTADKDINEAKDILDKLQEKMLEVQKVLDGTKNETTKLIENSAKEIINTVGDSSKDTGIKTDGKGNTKDTKIQRKISPVLVQQAIFMNINVSGILATSKKITAACSTHAKACDNLMGAASKINDTTTSPEAKRGYKLCQIYMRSSNLFSQLSIACTQVLTSKATKIKDLGEDD